MESIRELVEKLIGSPDVVGLIEYGSAQYQDRDIHGDYDLFAVLTERAPEVESLHFYVGDTPVDLNLRTLDEIRVIVRAEGFDSVLLDGRIIHDPSGGVSREIRALRERHQKSSSPTLSPRKVGGLRHGARHTFDKLRDGRHGSTTLGRYMLHQCVYWALPQYFEVRGLQYRGEKHALAYLRQNEPDLYDAFKRFYASADFDRQARLAKTIEEEVLAPIGGLWKRGEILAFGDQAKGREVFQKLFGDIRPVLPQERA